MTERAESIRVFDHRRITRVLRFADTNVAEIMIPMAELEAVSNDTSTADAIALINEKGHRRVPVFDGMPSNIIGVFAATPWQKMDPEFALRPIVEHLREPLFINPYQSVDEVLPLLWKNAWEMGIVVDEFGSAVGVLTVDEIIEEVVGEVEFEEEATDDGIRRRRVDRLHRRHNYEILARNVVLMDARMTLSEANEILGVELPTGEYHSVGGLVLARCRHIPKVGEEVIEQGYRFIVEEGSARGIDKLRVEPAEEREQGKDESGQDA